MKPKTIILMVVAIGCGLAASYMTSKLLAERNTEPPKEETVTLLVAKAKVPRGTLLKEPEKFFEARERRKADAPQSYFTDPAQVKDKRLKKEIKQDVHVSPEDLVEKATSALGLPDGHGAIGLTVTAASAASFFVNPGDKVDIIMTRSAPDLSSQTILRDVLVVTVGDKAIRPDGEGPGALQANTVTVALKPEDAQKVRLAEKLGELSLLLRKEGDDLKQSAKVTKPDDLLRPAFGQPAAPAAAPPAAKAEDPDLPFSTRLSELKELKAEPKAGKDKEEEPVAEVKPDWKITIYPGAGAPVQFSYYKQHDGSLSRDEPAAAEPRKKDGPEKQDKGKDDE